MYTGEWSAHKMYRYAAITLLVRSFALSEGDKRRPRHADNGARYTEAHYR